MANTSSSRQSAAPRRKSPTIIDVAAEAGVSIGTASKALNGKGQLRPQTIERVRRAADTLGFMPNDLVRSVLRGRSYTVGLLTNDLLGRFSIPLLLGIEETLSNSDISVFLAVTRNDPRTQRLNIDALLARQIDGLIICGDDTNPKDPIDLGNRDVPTVYTYYQSTDPNTVVLLPNDEQGASIATAHLAEVGCTRLAHIPGSPDYEATHQRQRGFVSTCQKLGISGVVAADSTMTWSGASGRAATQRLLEAHPEIDGIVCGADTIAMGVIEALHEAGRNVPNDVAVIGYDDQREITTNTTPPLSSIDMNMRQLGARACQELLGIIDGQERSGVIRMDCSLVPRASTARSGAGSPDRSPEHRDD